MGVSAPDPVVRRQGGPFAEPIHDPGREPSQRSRVGRACTLRRGRRLLGIAQAQGHVASDLHGASWVGCRAGSDSSGACGCRSALHRCGCRSCRRSKHVVRGRYRPLDAANSRASYTPRASSAARGCRWRSRRCACAWFDAGAGRTHDRILQQVVEAHAAGTVLADALGAAKLPFRHGSFLLQARMCADSRPESRRRGTIVLRIAREHPSRVSCSTDGDLAAACHGSRLLSKATARAC